MNGQAHFTPDYFTFRVESKEQETVQQWSVGLLALTRRPKFSPITPPIQSGALAYPITPEQQIDVIQQIPEEDEQGKTVSGGPIFSAAAKF